MRSVWGGKLGRVLQRLAYLASDADAVNETDQPWIGGPRAHPDLGTVGAGKKPNVCPLKPGSSDEHRIRVTGDLLDEASRRHRGRDAVAGTQPVAEHGARQRDRKSTRLNSS